MAYIFLNDYNAVKPYISELENYDCVKFCGIHCNNEIYEHNKYLIMNQQQPLFIPDSLSRQIGAQRFYTNAQRPKIYLDISSNPLFEYYSVVFSALNFALYTQPKKIYLIGCDCAKNGYWDKSKDNKDMSVEKVIDGYKTLKLFRDIYFTDTSIVSFNPIGLKGLFDEDVYTVCIVQ